MLETLWPWLEIALALLGVGLWWVYVVTVVAEDLERAEHDIAQERWLS